MENLGLWPPLQLRRHLGFFSPGCAVHAPALGLCNKMEVPYVRLQALLICFTVPLLFWLSACVMQLR